MTSTDQPALTDPDKVGLLIQCRLQMDQLKPDQLYEYTRTVYQILSNVQLKSLLFVGLNSIRNDVSYSQLFEMKSSINQIIESSKSLQDKSNAKDKDKTVNSETLKIPKNASFSEIIPFDIISNAICQYLTMSSITNLAKCDRKLSIICHTPTSILNLMHRYDPYPYIKSDLMIDGYYNNFNNNKLTIVNTHRFSNIKKLSIDIDFVENELKIFNSFRKVTDLCLYTNTNWESWYLFEWNKMQLLPALQRIAFVNLHQIPFVLSFLERYKNTEDTTGFYNHIMYQLKSIEIVDCTFGKIDSWMENDQDEEDSTDNKTQLYKKYKNISKFLFPEQPNNLKMLKLENSHLSKTVHAECDDANDAFESIEIMKQSLMNLKGFVYGEPDEDNGENENLFLNLTRNILSHLTAFKKLKSIHVHSIYDDLISIFLNDVNINQLNNITELCVSTRMDMDETSPLLSLKTYLPKLKKLCLVVNVPEEYDRSYVDNFEKMLKSILKTNKKIRLLQIVAKVMETSSEIDSVFCAKIMHAVSEFCQCLVKCFNFILNDWNYSRLYVKQPLLFKFHIKVCHSTFVEKCEGLNSNKAERFACFIENIITKYLIVYPLGKIQFKYSINVRNHHNIFSKLEYCFKGLDGLFAVDVKEGGNFNHLRSSSGVCYNEMDFKQYSINAVKLDSSDTDVIYDKNWKVDCRYCCNTPWV